MSLVCVLGSFRASVCAFRVSELLVVRLSFVVKLFLVALRFVRDSEVFVSNFEFEFLVSLLYSISRISIFDSSVEFKFLEFSCRILKSNFEFEFFVSLLYSISRISIFDSSSEFKCLEFSSRICRRNFRCLALFDFSNFDSKVSLLYSTSRNRSSNSTSRSSTSRVKSLEFRIRLDLFDFSNFDSNSSSKFRFEIVVEIVVCEPNS